MDAQDAVFAPVPHSVFSLDGVSRSEKYSLWKDSVSCIFDVEADRRVSSSDIETVVDTHLFGQSMLVRTMTFQQSWHRNEQTIARDSMDHFMIHIFEAGRLFFEQNNDQVTIDQSGIMVLDLSREFDSWCEDFTNLSLVIPRPLVTRYLRNPDHHHLRFLSFQSPMVKLLSANLKSFKDMASQITFSQSLELNVSLASLLATCLNEADEAPGANEEGSLAVSRRMLVQHMIEQNLHDPNLSVESLAHMASVSRSQLYEFFRSSGGVKSFIQERRMKMAMRRLLDPSYSHQSIEQISSSVGFMSASAFSQSFRKRFDFSPRTIRSNGHSHLSFKQASSGADRSYEDWLRHL